MEQDYLDFNIQLFAEADNADDNNETNTDTSEDVDLENEEQEEQEEQEVTSEPEDANGNKEEPIDKTKAFSTRLKQKTKEIEDKYQKSYNDKLDNLAKIKGFKNWEEYEKASQRDVLVEAGVEDPDKFQDTLQRMISENPEVLKAKRIIEENAEREKEIALEKEINLINKINPAINSLEDISKEENCQEVIDRLNKGYGLYDAYILSNLDKINANNVEKKKKKAINNVNTKKHLNTTRGGSKDYVEVPKDVYDTYKKNLPSWSDKQIRDHYAKTMKGETNNG